MIGIFDSGIGGLSVLAPLRHACESDILYLADGAHLPYGEKSEQALFSYANAALDFFEQREADAVIFACGTLSCTVLPHLRHTPMPVFGVAEPAITAVCQRSVNRRVAIAATEATVRSGYLQKRLRDAGLSVVAIPCPPFAKLVEDGADKDTLRQAVQAALAPAKAFGADTVLLGCTHYACLKEQIRLTLPTAAQIDCGKEAARAFLKTAHAKKERGKTAFYTTADKAAFASRLARLLGDVPGKIEEIQL